MRVTWQIDWLSVDQRSEVQARLEAMGSEKGGADRVEIVSRELDLDSSACTEVRITGVARKCQMTAVREHPDPARALNDALEAFSRSLDDVLSFDPDEMLGSALRPASTETRPRRSRGLSPFKRSSRSKAKAPARSRATWGWVRPMRRLALAGMALVLVGAGGAWWMRSGEDSLRIAAVGAPDPSARRDDVVEGPLAYTATAGGAATSETPLAFSAVARRGR